MITPAFARVMTTYNSEMNARFYAAAGRLPDAARRERRGAFWASIHGTFNHLLWADCMWMSRFDGWAAPSQSLKESAGCYAGFKEMVAARADIDGRLVAWAEQLSEAWLAGDQEWFSGAAGATLRAPRALLVIHLFNHQTHHRGQIHAMLTAAGETTGDTDLPLVLPGLVDIRAGAVTADRPPVP